MIQYNTYRIGFSASAPQIMMSNIIIMFWIVCILASDAYFPRTKWRRVGRIDHRFSPKRIPSRKTPSVSFQENLDKDGVETMNSEFLQFPYDSRNIRNFCIIAHIGRFLLSCILHII